MVVLDASSISYIYYPLRHQELFVLREKDEVRFNIIGEVKIEKIIFENAPMYIGGNIPIF